MTVFIIYLILGVASLFVVLLSDYSDGQFSAFRKLFKEFKYGGWNKRSTLLNGGTMAVIFWPLYLYWSIYKSFKKN